VPSLASVPFLPKSLEWSISKCVFDYAFDAKHRVKATVLQPEKAYVRCHVYFMQEALHSF
jgi:hypothetical protein